MTDKEIVDHMTLLETEYQKRMREINRDERRLWLLLLLIATAPELIWLGRRLLG